jgi:acyl dehydratase
MTTAERRKDPIAVGTILGEREFVVGEEQLTRYVEGIDVRNPWYAEDSPYGGPVCPASILFYEPMRFPASQEYGRDRPIFNARGEWEFCAPARPGQRLTLRSKVADRWIKRGREYASFEMEVRDETGKLLCVGRIINTWDDPPAYDPPLPSRDNEPRTPPAEGDGAELGTMTRTYTFEMSVAGAGPAINFHTDRQIARDRGFDDVVIAGPQFVCQMSELMTRIFGRGWYEGGKLRVNFLRPVIAGEAITARVVESRRTRDGDGVERMEVAIWCENEAGQQTAAGTASARLVEGEPAPVEV